jgi:hypothetical protein
MSQQENSNSVTRIVQDCFCDNNNNGDNLCIYAVFKDSPLLYTTGHHQVSSNISNVLITGICVCMEVTRV